MSANDPLRKPGPRGVVRSPGGNDDSGSGRPPALEVIRCNYRPSDADFYCWKFGVWYNVMDCCYRHDQRTFEGCIDCGQGRGNLRQNLDRYRARRPGRGSIWGP
ncbi:MAG TPA: hypothetical protein VFB49_01335 [Patescibacteria group bacterium]|nr:hypothetical protein [Patescibacteria group bacterium]